jgi:hypothetical protein
MIKRQLVYAGIWALALLVWGVCPGAAADFPYPKVEFSADMMMTLKSVDGGQDYEMKGKIYSAKGKERREVSDFGHTTAIIVDREKKETLTLMPALKMYLVDQSTKPHKDPETMIRDGEMKMTQKGSEKINGQTTTKYLMESMQGGKETFSGYAWFTKQNIPVRFTGTATAENMRQEIEINYTNIVIAKQNPALFKVPGDFRPMPTGLGGMMGKMGKEAEGMRPEQIEQMKEMFKKQKRP